MASDTQIPRRPGERGEGNLGCIFWAVVMIVVIHVGWIAVPVKMASAQLEDFMVDQAAAADRVPESAIKKRIVAKARDLELHLNEKQVKVQKQRERIRMQASYTETLTFFGGFEYEWTFQHDVDRPIFIY